jgi:hypothetical protein
MSAVCSRCIGTGSTPCRECEGTGYAIIAAPVIAPNVVCKCKHDMRLVQSNEATDGNMAEWWDCDHCGRTYQRAVNESGLAVREVWLTGDAQQVTPEPLAELDTLRTKLAAAEARVRELEESIKFAVDGLLKYRSGAQTNLIAVENRLLIEVTALTPESRAALKGN